MLQRFNVPCPAGMPFDRIERESYIRSCTLWPNFYFLDAVCSGTGSQAELGPNVKSLHRRKDGKHAFFAHPFVTTWRTCIGNVKLGMAGQERKQKAAAGDI